MADPTTAVPDVDWLLPGSAVKPADVVRRVEYICTRVPDLYAALLLVHATHQLVAAAHLAVIVKRVRPELRAMAESDVAGLINSISAGGRPGFDAVLRHKSKPARPKVSLPWSTDS